MAGNTEGDGEELRRWMMLPAGIWMLRIGWGLTAMALAAGWAALLYLYRLR